MMGDICGYASGDLKNYYFQVTPTSIHQYETFPPGGNLRKNECMKLYTELDHWFIGLCVLSSDWLWLSGVKAERWICRQFIYYEQ